MKTTKKRRVGAATPARQEKPWTRKMTQVPIPIIADRSRKGKKNMKFTLEISSAEAANAICWRMEAVQTEMSARKAVNRQRRKSVPSNLTDRQKELRQTFYGKKEEECAAAEAEIGAFINAVKRAFGKEAAE